MRGRGVLTKGHPNSNSFDYLLLRSNSSQRGPGSSLVLIAAISKRDDSFFLNLKIHSI